MTRSARLVPLLFTATLVAACAPDALKPLPGYNGFLQQVQQVCAYTLIGTYYAGDLAGDTGSMQSVYFIDQTSRLYFYKITPDNWIAGVTAFMQGRSSDPGIRCVLDQLDKWNRPGPPTTM